MKDEEGFDREILSDVQAERTHLKAELLRASNELAELRKRNEELERACREVFTADCNNECFCSALVRTVLASPPSPAPVESKPKEGA
jgi:hypothetical protein